MEDLYIQEWCTAIHQQDKMCTYRLIKTNFCIELYLNSQQPKYRMALSRLRLSSHTLGIEIGRYPPRIPRNERYCTYCLKHDIDDEFHFVLVCDLHIEYRCMYIPRYYRTRTSMVKFIELMKLDDARIQLNVAKYVYLSCKQRETHVTIR